MREIFGGFAKFVNSEEYVKKAIPELIDKVYQGGSKLVHIEHGAQLAYERWTDLIDVIERYISRTDNEALVKHLRDQINYIKSERDLLYSRYASIIDKDEQLFSSVWNDNPILTEHMNERLRQRYREPDSFFELANWYYQSRSDGETWKSVFAKMNSEQTELGMEKRYTTFESFQSALKRYRRNKSTLK